jgi:hypothetical protein
MTGMRGGGWPIFFVLTPLTTVVLEKLIVAQIAKKFPGFYGK